MKPSFWIWFLVGGLVAVVPVSAQAQHFRRPFPGCCETCERSHAQCNCTVTRPVVQTQLRPQQVITYRDVTETQIRNETVVQNVPVTTFREVTVDEGNYQMVWVPKPVTKRIAQTVIQQQARTRAVPYQVTRRTPQVTTQMVPVQTIGQIVETVPVATALSAWAVPTPTAFNGPAQACNTCGNQKTTNAPWTYLAPQVGSTLLSAPIVNSPIAVPTMPAIAIPLPQQARISSPDDASADQWQTIKPRSSDRSQNRDYGSPSSRTVPPTTEEARGMNARSSMFVPAPTAATVWSTRR